MHNRSSVWVERLQWILSPPELWRDVLWYALSLFMAGGVFTLFHGWINSAWEHPQYSVMGALAFTSLFVFILMRGIGFKSIAVPIVGCSVLLGGTLAKIMALEGYRAQVIWSVMLVVVFITGTVFVRAIELLRRSKRVEN